MRGGFSSFLGCQSWKGSGSEGEWGWSLLDHEDVECRLREDLEAKEESCGAKFW